MFNFKQYFRKKDLDGIIPTAEVFMHNGDHGVEGPHLRIYDQFLHLTPIHEVASVQDISDVHIAYDKHNPHIILGWGKSPHHAKKKAAFYHGSGVKLSVTVAGKEMLPYLTPGAKSVTVTWKKHNTGGGGVAIPLKPYVAPAAPTQTQTSAPSHSIPLSGPKQVSSDDYFNHHATDTGHKGAWAIINKNTHQIADVSQGHKFALYWHKHHTQKHGNHFSVVPIQPDNGTTFMKHYTSNTVPSYFSKNSEGFWASGQEAPGLTDLYVDHTNGVETVKVAKGSSGTSSPPPKKEPEKPAPSHTPAPSTPFSGEATENTDIDHSKFVVIDKYTSKVAGVYGSEAEANAKKSYSQYKAKATHGFHAAYQMYPNLKVTVHGSPGNWHYRPHPGWKAEYAAEKYDPASNPKNVLGGDHEPHIAVHKNTGKILASGIGPKSTWLKAKANGYHNPDDMLIHHASQAMIQAHAADPSTAWAIKNGKAEPNIGDHAQVFVPQTPGDIPDKISKLQAHYNYAQSAIQSIRHYVMGGFRAINKAFWHNTMLDQEHHEHAETINETLKTSKSPVSLRTFVGVKYDPSTIPDNHVSRRKVVAAPAFSSASLDWRKSLEFAGNDDFDPHDGIHPTQGAEGQKAPRHIVQLHIPAGARVGYIGHVSGSPENHEVIVPRGARFQLSPKPIHTHVDEHSGQHYHVWYGHLVHDGENYFPDPHINKSYY
jgi:hypothetical protein